MEEKEGTDESEALSPLILAFPKWLSNVTRRPGPVLTAGRIRRAEERWSLLLMFVA